METFLAPKSEGDFSGKSNYLSANQPLCVLHFRVCFRLITPIITGQAHVLVGLLISGWFKVRGKKVSYVMPHHLKRQTTQTSCLRSIPLSFPILSVFNPASWQQILPKRRTRRPGDLRRRIIVSEKHRPSAAAPAFLLLAVSLLKNHFSAASPQS